MGGLYKMLLLWFPGNKPLHCDFLGDFVVNFHGCYYFSWVSSFLVKWCWLIKKRDGICTWAYFVEKRSQRGLPGADQESELATWQHPGCLMVTGPRTVPLQASLDSLPEHRLHGLLGCCENEVRQVWLYWRTTVPALDPELLEMCGLSLLRITFSRHAGRDAWFIHDLIKKELFCLWNMFNHAKHGMNWSSLYVLRGLSFLAHVCRSWALTTPPPCWKPQLLPGAHRARPSPLAEVPAILDVLP